jgi:hypothetical protein
MVELWTAFSGSADPWTSMTLAALGVTLAMLGPGAWSVDARLFGRKHIYVTQNGRFRPEAERALGVGTGANSGRRHPA